MSMLAPALSRSIMRRAAVALLALPLLAAPALATTSERVVSPGGMEAWLVHEPAVPMIYLASKQEPRTQNDYQSPEYDARIIKAQKAFVHRFSPGRFEWVDAPHFMEPVIPDQIAKAVREVAALAQH